MSRASQRHKTEIHGLVTGVAAIAEAAFPYDFKAHFDVSNMDGATYQIFTDGVEGDLPTGGAFDEATGILSGDISGGPYEVVVCAINSSGGKACTNSATVTPT